MERFKVVERETKTKAYSKEGLTSGTKLDPAEKERSDISRWLNECLDTLNIQIDQFEAEIESLGNAKKKKGGKNNNSHNEQVDEFRNLLEKHRDHVQKIETLLRMLDNDTVNIEQVFKHFLRFFDLRRQRREMNLRPFLNFELTSFLVFSRSKTSRKMLSIISRTVRNPTSVRTR